MREKVFCVPGECTERYLMQSPSWKAVARALRAAGVGHVSVRTATTKVSADDRAVAARHPGVLLVQDGWNDPPAVWRVVESHSG